jgi:hypothetical protein
MRRDKRREEGEQRFLTRQARLRERRQRKMNSLPLVSSHDGSNGPTIGEAGEPRYGTQIVGFLSASERVT